MSYGVRKFDLHLVKCLSLCVFQNTLGTFGTEIIDNFSMHATHIETIDTM